MGDNLSVNPSLICKYYVPMLTQIEVLTKDFKNIGMMIFFTEVM